MAPPRKRADFRVVSHHEIAWLCSKGGKCRWRGQEWAAATRLLSVLSVRPPTDARTGNRSTGTSVTKCEPPPGTHRESDRGRPVEQGACPATPLTHSFSGRALAVKRVTENKGKWTPGVDREIWTSSARKALAVRELRRRGYRALPLRRVYIEKAGKKAKRPLGIPVMKDRAMQALYLLGLAPIAEVTGIELQRFPPRTFGSRCAPQMPRPDGKAQRASVGP